MNSEMPLTDFLINLLKATDDQVKRACPVKMARKYGIREQDAHELLAHEKMMRGIRNERTTENAGS